VKEAGVKHSKRYLEAKSKVESRRYELREALELVRDIRFAKFDETVEIALRLGVDPRHADQMVRGTVVLPNGTGKSKKVLVVALGDAAKEAQEAGADFVMGEEAVEKIQGGWLDFDAMVATPEMMRHLSKLGKILGPRGLMPNPKTGTVSAEPGNAVRDIKAGKVEFRVDKTAIIHAPVGRVSFTTDALEENARSLIFAVLRAKPAAAKGKFVQSAYISSTMGPGVALDLAPLEAR
jgi:large subunit ribosomal protein L1